MIVVQKLRNIETCFVLTKDTGNIKAEHNLEVAISVTVYMYHKCIGFCQFPCGILVFGLCTYTYYMLRYDYDCVVREYAGRERCQEGLHGARGPPGDAAVTRIWVLFLIVVVLARERAARRCPIPPLQ